MNRNKYTEQSTLSELLAEPAARAFLDRVAPGMAGSPAITFVAGMPIGQLIEGMPDKADMFQILWDLANGKEPSVQLTDYRNLPPKINGTELEYNIDDVDGMMYMLEHRFSGCVVLRFSKIMNESIYGTATCEGKVLPKGLIRKIESAGGIQMFGLPVREICTDYNKSYTIHIEGFEDMDGNRMEPQEIMIKTLPKPEMDPTYATHDAVSLDAAREGIILLKNEGNLLPLQPDAEIEIWGESLFRLGAVGAGKINPRYYLNLKRALGKCSNFKVLKQADIGIIVISRASGENYDNNAVKGEFYLTEAEETALKDLTSRCKQVIAVINSGYPMDTRWIETYDIPAVIWCGFPGMVGGQALVEIMDGRVNPSAKMPDTWTWDYYDHPSSSNFYLPEEGELALSADSPYFVDTFYEEGLYVGYRYFETFEKSVAFPFGFGLSYTQFAINAEYENTKVSVTITNIGNRTGKEVVQLYAAIPEVKLEQPSKRLISFAKTKLLLPGESEILELTVIEKQLSSFDVERASWIIEAGLYEFYAGNAVNSLKKCGQMILEKEKVLFVSENLMQPPVKICEFTKKKPDFPKGEQSGLKKEYTELTPKAVRRHYEAAPVDGDSLATKLSVRELARLSVCASHGWGLHETGEAGRIYQLEGRNLPRYAVADGNNGVNVNRPNIGMPCSNTVCATWNPKLAYEIGRVIAEEAVENDIAMILAPAMNIHRNPLNGRHPEYFSEDPYLAGIMAGNQCKGLEENGVDGSVKHIIGNNCETARKRNHSFIPERALREIYLKVFEVALSVHQPASLMTSYNAVNGSFAAEDEEMLQGIFRKEFGFQGFIMTDWNSYDTVNIVEAVRAGNCWLTPGSTDDTYVQPIVEGVESGRIEEKRLRHNIGTMLKVVLKRN